MQELSLDKKYRPKTLDEFIGNSSIKDALRSNIRKDKRINSILLQGPSGNGKTTLARIIANMVGVKEKDINEMNISKQGGIDAARALIENTRYAPLGSSRKVYILDECQGGDKKARDNFQNTILKLLEEPPKHCIFILCTTEPEKLLKTIRTRCTVYQVASLRVKELTTLIKRVLVEEGKRSFPKEAISEIAIAADGSARQALVILDSVINIEDEEKIIKSINDFSVNKEVIINLCWALLGNKKWSEIAEIIKNLDEEPESIRYAVLGIMNSIMLNPKNKMDKMIKASLIISEFTDPFYSGKAILTNACFNVKTQLEG